MLKSLFLNNFSIWVKVYIGDGYTHLIDFIEWLGIWLRDGVFFFRTLFSISCLFYLYTTSILLRSFRAFLIQFLTYQKKKKVTASDHGDEVSPELHQLVISTIQFFMF